MEYGPEHGRSTKVVFDNCCCKKIHVKHPWSNSHGCTYKPFTTDFVFLTFFCKEKH